MSESIAIKISSESDTGTSFMDLPPEIRFLILHRLDLTELRSMRLVSQKIRSEIDHGLGLHVSLRGPKPWTDWNFTDDLRCLRAFGNPEPKRVEHNINWISNTLVRSLNIGRLVGLSFDPLTLIPSPLALQRLVIQLDEDPAPKTKVLETLAVFSELRTLSIICSAPRSKLPLRKIEEYRLFCVEFCKDVLASLVTKQGLKEFRIIVTIWNAWLYETATFLGIPPELNPAEPLPEYPSTLTSIKIQLKIYRNLNDWVHWKALLDCQTQLRDLCVDIGFPYWGFFETVVRNNVNTLKTIEVAISNSATKREYFQIIGQIPEPSQMNWTEFLTQSQNLTTLKVTMNACSVPIGAGIPAMTVNFAQLQLTYLTTLELKGVLLEQAEFTKIFGDLPELRDLNLMLWSQPILVMTEATRQACELLANALKEKRLERIQLTDWSIPFCPIELREIISSQPNYKTIWPLPVANTIRVLIALYLGKRLTMTAIRQIDHL